MKKDILIKMMKTTIVTCFLISTFSSTQILSECKMAPAAQNTYEIQYTMMFSTDDFVFDTFMGYDQITLSDGGVLAKPSCPLLPVKHIRIALPPGMKVTTITVLSTEEQTLDGTYTIVPAQGPQPTSISSTNVSFIQPDAQVYESNMRYPVEFVTFAGETDLAGQALAEVDVYPLHYLPKQQQVQVLTSITFCIEGTNGYVCGDYLPTGISEEGRARYEQMIHEMVENPEEIQLRSSEAPQTRDVPSGDYAYVIITQSSWVSAFQSLVDWKTKKGIPATIVTTDWIYDTYTGSTDVEKIKAFVQDAYSTWGTIFLLLGGDIDVIPPDYILIEEVDQIPIAYDTCYADFDSDWVIEVNVGRASVTGPGMGVGGIGNFINKVLTYEKNPPLTDYAKKAALFGFDLDILTFSEEIKIFIDDNYIPSDWTMSNVYDSHEGDHKANVIAAINEGQNLINHIDHSGWNLMGTGRINHNGSCLEFDDVDNFTNGNKQCIVYSTGCKSCAYNWSACIAEHFVRNTDSGAVAFIGNSGLGFYYTGNNDIYSSRYDRYFFRSLFEQNHYKLGDCLSDHKNAYYPPESDLYYRYVWLELTLLGDPELPVWKEDPATIDTVSYPDTIPTGTQTFTVTVNDGDSPLSDAQVCVQKGSEVYAYGTTNSTGQITFSIMPTTTGSMDVTVTKQNFLPWEGTATIIDILPGDLDHDGDVDLSDLAQLLAYYGTASGATYEMGDLDGDGDVDLSDLATLLAHYGT